MSESAKLRCDEEWRKFQSDLKATPLDTNAVKEMYDSGMTQTEIAKVLGTSQKVIWRHMKNHKMAARTAYKRDQYEEKNSYWRDGRTTTIQGYIHIRCPNHPRASKDGNYVPEHVLVMEQHLGRYLKWEGTGNKNSEVVHHINGNKQDNRIENLQLTTFAEHMKIHREQKKGGDALCR